jgi:protein TonB
MNRTNHGGEGVAGSRLKSELARHCLPAANRDSNRKLAWVNSICLLFLLIGVVGARPAANSLKTPPPLEEVIPAIIESAPPPPATEQPQTEKEVQPDKPDTPQVVVVTPESPAISFSVPTIGNVQVPSALAAAPPLEPLKAPAPLRNLPANINTTGSGGERPAPPYPQIAKEQGEQGPVTLLISVNDAGLIESVEIKQSSGHGLLDKSAQEYVRKHWIIPPTGSTRLYETTINFVLQR